MLDLWITVLKIWKLNQFASDSIVLQNTFNYVFPDYFMPRHKISPSFPHCDWIPTLLSPTLLSNLCWNTEAALCLHRTYKSHHSDLRRKKRWQWIGPPLFKYSSNTSHPLENSNKKLFYSTHSILLVFPE